jgi:hypothetical protein
MYNLRPLFKKTCYNIFDAGLDIDINYNDILEILNVPTK